MWTSSVNEEKDKIKEMAFAKLRCFLGFTRYCYIENRIKWFKTLNAILEHKSIGNFHAVYNKWDLKSQDFSYLCIVMRSQLAVLDFNNTSGLEHARTKSGEKRYNVGYSKITKTWSSKPIKAKNDNSYLKEMV